MHSYSIKELCPTLGPWRLVRNRSVVLFESLVNGCNVAPQALHVSSSCIDLETNALVTFVTVVYKTTTLTLRICLSAKTRLEKPCNT